MELMNKLTDAEVRELIRRGWPEMFDAGWHPRVSRGEVKFVIPGFDWELIPIEGESCFDERTALAKFYTKTDIAAKLINPILRQRPFPPTELQLKLRDKLRAKEFERREPVAFIEKKLLRTVKDTSKNQVNEPSKATKRARIEQRVVPSKPSPNQIAQKKVKASQASPGERKRSNEEAYSDLPTLPSSLVNLVIPSELSLSVHNAQQGVRRVMPPATQKRQNEQLQNKQSQPRQGEDQNGQLNMKARQDQDQNEQRDSQTVSPASQTSNKSQSSTSSTLEARSTGQVEDHVRRGVLQQVISAAAAKASGHLNHHDDSYNFASVIRFLTAAKGWRVFQGSGLVKEFYILPTTRVVRGKPEGKLNQDYFTLSENVIRHVKKDMDLRSEFFTFQMKHYDSEQARFRQAQEDKQKKQEEDEKAARLQKEQEQQGKSRLHIDVIKIPSAVEPSFGPLIVSGGGVTREPLFLGKTIIFSGRIDENTVALAGRLGATVVDYRNHEGTLTELGDPKWNKDCIFIAPPRSSLGLPWFSALAAGFAIIHPNFVRESALAGKLLPLGNFVFPSGPSMFQDDFGWVFAVEGSWNRSQRRILKGTSIHLLACFGFRELKKLIVLAGGQLVTAQDKSANLWIADGDSCCVESMSDLRQMESGENNTNQPLLVSHDFIFQVLINQSFDKVFELAHDELFYVRVRDSEAVVPRHENALYENKNGGMKSWRWFASSGKAEGTFPNPHFSWLRRFCTRIEFGAFFFLKCLDKFQSEPRVRIGQFMKMKVSVKNGAVESWAVFRVCSFELLESRMLDIELLEEYFETRPEFILGVVPFVRKKVVRDRFGEKFAESSVVYLEKAPEMFDLTEFLFQV